MVIKTPRFASQQNEMSAHMPACAAGVHARLPDPHPSDSRSSNFCNTQFR